jgi:2-oxoglutarate ferredoxin oxidoreductase subunit delta
MGKPNATETAEKKAGRRRSLPRGRVTVFPNWCKGCDLCIEFCPAGVLDHRPGVNVVAVHPEKCTACRWCELHCPDFAIFVADVEDRETEPEIKA